jgi:hypothetical protein
MIRNLGNAHKTVGRVHDHISVSYEYLTGFLGAHIHRLISYLVLSSLPLAHHFDSIRLTRVPRVPSEFTPRLVLFTSLIDRYLSCLGEEGELVALFVIIGTEDDVLWKNGDQASLRILRFESSKRIFHCLDHSNVRQEPFPFKKFIIPSCQERNERLGRLQHFGE